MLQQIMEREPRKLPIQNQFAVFFLAISRSKSFRPFSDFLKMTKGGEENNKRVVCTYFRSKDIHKYTLRIHAAENALPDQL